MRAHHERYLRFGEPDFDGLGHQKVFALKFACHGCGASPPAIGTVERFSVAAGRGAAGASPVSTVERRRVATGRGSTCASSIGPVEPSLLSGSCLVDRQAHESDDQSREQHSASLSPAHFVHAFPPDEYRKCTTEVLCFLVAVSPAQELLLCAKHLFADAKASG